MHGKENYFQSMEQAIESRLTLNDQGRDHGHGCGRGKKMNHTKSSEGQKL